MFLLRKGINGCLMKFSMKLCHFEEISGCCRKLKVSKRVKVYKLFETLKSCIIRTACLLGK